jgi:hypothetical protein
VERAAAAAEVLFVAGEHRGAEPGGELADAQAAERERPGYPARGPRPDHRIDGVDVGWRRRRMFGRQHVSVARAGGMGDAAHGTPR